VKVYAVDDRELMDISEVVPDGNALLLRGRIFGSMPVTAKLTPREMRAALKLLTIRKVVFLVSLFFRRG
jgi:hypothetical protein